MYPSSSASAGPKSASVRLTSICLMVSSRPVPPVRATTRLTISSQAQGLGLGRSCAICSAMLLAWPSVRPKKMSDIRCNMACAARTCSVLPQRCPTALAMKSTSSSVGRRAVPGRPANAAIGLVATSSGPDFSASLLAVRTFGPKSVSAMSWSISRTWSCCSLDSCLTWAIRAAIAMTSASLGRCMLPPNSASTCRRTDSDAPVVRRVFGGATTRCWVLL
mmetsp:Transcript_135180/g.432066  ORF Transcript_135180/g.432066 Transcript_135180/m.432066 type:complete len:220 (-) Transcript_135180:3405-4064(-)